VHLLPRPRRWYAGTTALIAVAAFASTSCAGPADETEGDAGTGSDTTSAAPVETPSGPAPSTSPSPSSTPTPTTTPSPSEPAGPMLAVEIQGETVRPNAVEIRLDVGEPLAMTFDTDRAGELHVHSKPEQYVEFEAGTSTRELVVETPGSVKIEEHDTGAVVAVVEVS
jgi:hypothetical protein